eukprot:9422403-Lingulodinium_polyedra.AAC.1
MSGDPERADRLHQGLLKLVGGKLGCTPPNASVEHVEDYAFADEQKITLNLLVELVHHVNVANVSGAWFGPLSARTTNVDKCWYQVKYLL